MSASRNDRTLLRLPQLAREWGVDPRMLRELIGAGELVAVDLARPGASRPRYVVTREAAAAFLRRRQVVASPAAREAPP